MKVLVRILNIAALISIMCGGSMLDECIPTAMAVIAPGAAWIGLTAWVNR